MTIHNCPTCACTKCLIHLGPIPCTREAGHKGSHKDSEGGTWRMESDIVEIIQLSPLIILHWAEIRGDKPQWL